jgi:hypothetical protein
MVAVHDNLTFCCGCCERNARSSSGCLTVLTGVIDVVGCLQLGTIDGSVDLIVGDIDGLLGKRGRFRIGASHSQMFK